MSIKDPTDLFAGVVVALKHSSFHTIATRPERTVLTKGTCTVLPVQRETVAADISSFRLGGGLSQKHYLKNSQLLSYLTGMDRLTPSDHKKRSVSNWKRAG